MIFYKEPHVDIHIGDCREVLKEMPAESVQCVVTSPPYWGLRKYEGEQELIWSDDHCEHEWGDLIPHPQRKSGKHGPASIVAEGTKIAEHEIRINSNQGQLCLKCSAWRGAYGLEPQPEMYVEHTIEFLRLIRRVLRKDGVVFWNIGDSYAGSGSPGGDFRDGKGGDEYLRPYNRKGEILKPKDLCLIPFRVAIAAQEAGWWVRSVIIWSKPNPMPESVKDRPTESHEYILMLTKAKSYYWDQEAVREPFLPQSLERISQHLAHQHGGMKEAAFMDDSVIPGGGDRKRHSKILKRLKGSIEQGLSGRNLRTVWEFPTQPFKDAHFAVFPTELPRRCILAATSEKGNCPKCGKPWVRVIGRVKGVITEAMKVAGCNQDGGYDGSDSKGYAMHGVQSPSDTKRRILESMQTMSRTIGWRPQCSCGVDPIPAIVLDPFSGSGTAGEVAKSLGRKAILIDTSGEYCSLAQKRIEAVSLPMLYCGAGGDER